MLSRRVSGLLLNSVTQYVYSPKNLSVLLLISTRWEGGITYRQVRSLVAGVKPAQNQKCTFMDHIDIIINYYVPILFHFIIISIVMNNLACV